MKRCIFFMVITFIALQFTCGHVSDNQLKASVINDQEIAGAVSEMNKSHYEFWKLSYSIDSLLKDQQRKEKKLKLIRASYPVHY